MPLLRIGACSLGLAWLAGCAEPPTHAPTSDPTPPPPSDTATTSPTAVAPSDIEPPIVAYGTPVIEVARVVREGPKAQIRLRWSKVEGAKKYEVQVSKVLTFSRTAAEASSPKPGFASRWIEPSVYFWRVRAIGNAGTGAYTDVQVLDATKTGARGKRLAKPVEVAESIEPMTALASSKNGPPLRLVWRKPEHQAIVTTTPVAIEGLATRGTVVEIRGTPPVTVDATFSISIALIHGRNDLVLIGKLGDQVKRIERSIYYADPIRLGPIRDRFEALRKQLEEIGSIRDELSQTIKSLESRLKTTSADSTGVAEIKTEMERITQIRKEIDGEVGKAIKELDQLLGS